MEGEKREAENKLEIMKVELEELAKKHEEEREGLELCIAGLKEEQFAAEGQVEELQKDIEELKQSGEEKEKRL